MSQQQKPQQIFRFPLVDGYELEFVVEPSDDEDAPALFPILSPPGDNEEAPSSGWLFGVDLNQFTGRVVLRKVWAGVAEETTMTSTPVEVPYDAFDVEIEVGDAMLQSNPSYSSSHEEVEIPIESTKRMDARRPVWQSSAISGLTSSGLLPPLYEEPTNSRQNQELGGDSARSLPFDELSSTADASTSDEFRPLASEGHVSSTSVPGKRNSGFNSMVPPSSHMMHSRSDGDVSALGSDSSKPPRSPRRTSTNLNAVIEAAKRGQQRAYSSLHLSSFLRMRSSIPHDIRQAREMARSYSDQTVISPFGTTAGGGKSKLPKTLPKYTSVRLIMAPTRLHELCARSTVTLHEIEAELDTNPDAVSVLDARRRTPLHVLADNDQLFLEPQGKYTVMTAVLRLVHLYPEAITIKDATGRMPFVPLIEDWCMWVYEAEEERRRRAKNEMGGWLGSSDPNQLKTEGGVRASRTATRTAAQLRDGANRVLESVATTIASTITSRVDSLWSGGKGNADGDHNSLASKAGRLYPHVQVWDEVEFCFELMSMIMDELAGKHGGLMIEEQTELDPEKSIALESAAPSRTTYSADQDARREFATHIVETLPFLWKTILLIEDSTARKKIIQMSVFRRLRLCPESVGPWLTNMLRKKGVPAKRGVDFLLLISQSTAFDHVGAYRTIMQYDIEQFESARQEVFAEMEQLQSTIASLVVLEEKEVERAAACPAVWHIMNRNLARPFVIGIMLIDFVLHLTLMLAVRVGVGLKSSNDTISVSLGDIPTQTSLFICSHYIIRKSAEGMALFNLSPAVFRAYITNLWSLLDTITIILTLCAVSWNDRNQEEYRNGFNAIVVGLLWLKILGFMKVVNKHMSTFIMAVTQILRDLRYFAIVLVVVIFMFGDMMSIAISTEDDGKYCAENAEHLDDTVKDFCEVRRAGAYLRVYALLLGDFNLDSFRETKGMSILFFLFTIIGVIILLNVLIAVIDDSYEKSKIAGRNMFGRARVSFVAQNEALETFLLPGDAELEGLDLTRKTVARAVRIIRWLVLVTLIATSLNAEMYLAYQAADAAQAERERIWQYISMSVVLFLLLTIGLFIMVFVAFDHIVHRFCPDFFVRHFDVWKESSHYFVRLGARVIFGIRQKPKANGVSDEIYTETEEKEWNGRLNYMERMVERALIRTKQEISEEIKGLEQRLGEKNNVYGVFN